MPSLKDSLASNFDLSKYTPVVPKKPINQSQCCCAELAQLLTRLLAQQSPSPWSAPPICSVPKLPESGSVQNPDSENEGNQ